MWHLLMYAHKRNPDCEQLRIQNEDGHPAEGQWPWWEIISRFAMSYISNGLYKAIIVYTLQQSGCPEASQILFSMHLGLSENRVYSQL